MGEDQSIFSKVIISLILTTFALACVVILIEEDLCWSPLGLKGLLMSKVT